MKDLLFGLGMIYLFLYAGAIESIYTNGLWIYHVIALVDVIGMTYLSRRMEV